MKPSDRKVEPYFLRSPSGGLWPRQDSPPQNSVELSIVVPCFNEEQGLRQMATQLIGIAEMTLRPFEVVLVNDGSKDATRQIIQDLSENDARIVGISLARNFGQESAITAGLEIARGRMIALIDADLQDPPELIPQMVEVIEQGADLVYGQRITRDGETWFKKVTAVLFYKLMQYGCETPIPANTGHFRVMRRCVVDAVLAMPERDRFLRGMFSWVGFRQVAFPFHRKSRAAGNSKWPLGRMLRLSETAFVGFSSFPLRVPLALAVVCLTTCLITFLVWLMAGFETVGVGLISVMTSLVSLFSALQLISVYIVCRLISGATDDSRGRPLYVVSEVMNRPAHVDAAPAKGSCPPPKFDFTETAAARTKI